MLVYILLLAQVVMSTDRVFVGHESDSKLYDCHCNNTSRLILISQGFRVNLILVVL